jgi:hypothetical protein
MRCHYFRPDTGEILPDTIDVPEADLLLPANQRPGLALVPGVSDHRVQRVAAVVTDDQGQLVHVLEDYVPPAPTADELRTWAWDAQARRHVPVPTLLARQRQAQAPHLAELTEIDAGLVRPLGELLEAQALGQTAPAQALAKLQAANARKGLLRQQIATIAASTSEAQLRTIVESFV